MTKILLFGEPLIRITPLNNQEIADKMTSTIYYGGSEINVAKNLQGFDVNTKVITGLPNNAVGDSFIHYLNQYDIDTSSIQKTGDRIGLYYMEEGLGCRTTEVYYDRKHTSINDICIDKIDMNNLFKDITHFHFSGITIAVSKQVREILLTLLQEAKKRNIIISLDLNLRTKMISVEDAKKEFSKFAHYADYCFGIDPIMSDDQNYEMFDRYNATLEDIQKRMKLLKDKYSFKAIFHTLRTTSENGENIYQCYGLKNTFETSIQLKTAVLQRVGSGDAFIAGALYQIMNNATLKEIIDFAVASGTYKCTVDGDNMYVSVSKVKKLLENTQDIIR